MKKIFAVAFCLVLSTSLAAQLKGKEMKAYLDGVTERGRMMYEYDQAAWHGTDAFFELHPDTKGLGHYICKKEDNGWTVLFGSWNMDHSKFLIRYEAMEINHSGKYTAKSFDLPKEAPDDVVAMERAVDLALTEFKGEKRSYNVSILPTPSRNFYVYIYPSPTKTNVWPLGGDVRYEISSDGTKIVETRQLHKSILEIDYTSAPDKQLVSGYHTHILSDVPEDTDVFYVLTRKPPIPEFIGGIKKQVFSVETDGSIRIVQK